MKWYLHPLGQEFSQWSPRSIAKHLGNVSLPVNEPLAKLSVGVNTLYPLTDDGPTLEPYEQVASRSINVGADTATAVYTTENKPLADYKAQRKDEVTAKRYDVETGGTTVNGMTIETSRESQGLIDGAYSLAVRNADTQGFTIDFKSTSGWVELTAAQMIAISEAVGVHIQQSFKRERALHEAIDAAADHTAVAAIDITTGWPV
jgi:hypothetical protein